MRGVALWGPQCLSGLFLALTDKGHHQAWVVILRMSDSEPGALSPNLLLDVSHPHPRARAHTAHLPQGLSHTLKCSAGQTNMLPDFGHKALTVP